MFYNFIQLLDSLGKSLQIKAVVNSNSELTINQTEYTFRVQYIPWLVHIYKPVY